MNLIEKTQKRMQSKNNIIQNQQKDSFEISANPIIQNKESFIIQLNSDTIETKQKIIRKLRSMMVRVKNCRIVELQNCRMSKLKCPIKIELLMIMLCNDDMINKNCMLLIKEQESKTIKNHYEMM